jgi:putative transposase
VAAGAVAGAAQAGPQAEGGLAARPQAPAFLRSEHGPEFVSRALLSWIASQGIGPALIEPGKPWHNGVAESFNGKSRDA